MLGNCGSIPRIWHPKCLPRQAEQLPRCQRIDCQAPRQRLNARPTLEQPEIQRLSCQPKIRSAYSAARHQQPLPRRDARPNIVASRCGLGIGSASPVRMPCCRHAILRTRPLIETAARNLAWSRCGRTAGWRSGLGTAAVQAVLVTLVVSQRSNQEQGRSQLSVFKEQGHYCPVHWCFVGCKHLIVNKIREILSGGDLN